MTSSAKDAASQLGNVTWARQEKNQSSRNWWELLNSFFFLLVILLLPTRTRTTPPQVHGRRVCHGSHWASKSFDESICDWPLYDEILTSFLIVNKISDDSAVHAFLSVYGLKTYGLLKSLTAPTVPSTKPLNVLKQLLRDHLAPNLSIIGERAKIHRRCQLENESITQYVAVLRNMAQTCEFGSFLDESLRDRFVYGL